MQPTIVNRKCRGKVTQNLYIENGLVQESKDKDKTKKQIQTVYFEFDIIGV